MTRLAELLTTVVGDISGAVRSAATAAESDRRELQEACTDEPAELVDSAAVDRLLRERCPRLARPPTGLVSDALDDDRLATFRAGWQTSDTSVRAGNVYVDPWRGDTALSAEFPPIRREFGVELSDDDCETVDGVRLLTADAVTRVRSAVATQVGRRRQAAIRGVVADGVPSVAVSEVDVVIPTVYGRDGDRLTAEPAQRSATTPTADRESDEADAVGRLGLTVHVDRR